MVIHQIEIGCVYPVDPRVTLAMDERFSARGEHDAAVAGYLGGFRPKLHRGAHPLPTPGTLALAGGRPGAPPSRGRA